MNVQCTWVKGNDGALVIEWARADDLAPCWEASAGDWHADDSAAAYSFQERHHDTDALTSVGV
jgi:hypothetical protein